mmetsp:Transcript_42164/g.80638  ORF Transcript_42164/g.80638 Transcript_42164/m.80638 type:complete len:156 (+) Transcript_42164:2-469(+)
MNVRTVTKTVRRATALGTVGAQAVTRDILNSGGSTEDTAASVPRTPIVEQGSTAVIMNVRTVTRTVRRAMALGAVGAQAVTQVFLNVGGSTEDIVMSVLRIPIVPQGSDVKTTLASRALRATLHPQLRSTQTRHLSNQHVKAEYLHLILTVLAGP